MLTNLAGIYRQGRIELLDIPYQLKENTSVIITVLQVSHRTLTDSNINQVCPPWGRPVGLCAGEFVVPDDFDDPLPENLLRELVVMQCG